MDMNKYNEWPANHKGDKNPSPKIIALGKRITDVAGHMIGGVTAEDPEYWGLAEIITEEMAEVGLTMKRRAHYTFEKKRLLRSYSVLRTTVSYIRSQISMERTKSLVSVTVT